MRAIDYLKYLRERGIGPTSKEGSGLGPPSNSELRRWLDKGSVLFNGVRPKPADEVVFPVRQLQFFPGARLQTTLVWDSNGLQ
jgi:hypothetical protein